MNKIYFILLLSALCLLPFATASQARPDAPAPVEKGVNNASHKQQKQQLSKVVKNIEGTIEKNKQKLISLSKTILKSEQELYDIEKDIQAKDIERKNLSQQLKQDQNTVVDLIIALERIKKVPTIALYARPNAPLETAQAALILKQLSEDLANKASRIKTNNDELITLIDDLKNKKIIVDDKITSLEKQRDELNVYLKKQEILYRSSKENLAKKEKEIIALSKKSKNINDFLGNLSPPPVKPKSRALNFFSKSTSTSHEQFMPISGAIKVKYGEKDHLNAESKGWWIEGRGRPLVVAPMDGTVRFVGNFKSYGNIIIIEHPGNYHSLIAGLDNIHAALEQRLSAGQPIGTLNYQEKASSRLYYELRKSGKAIDPIAKLSKVMNN